MIFGKGNLKALAVQPLTFEKNDDKIDLLLPQVNVLTFSI